jgi:hypothetical protein
VNQLIKRFENGEIYFLFLVEKNAKFTISMAAIKAINGD